MNNNAMLMEVSAMEKLIQRQRSGSLTESQIKELVLTGEALDVLVSPEWVRGKRVVNIRDSQFDDFVKASVYLNHIRMNEIPSSFDFLIG